MNVNSSRRAGLLVVKVILLNLLLLAVFGVIIEMFFGAWFATESLKALGLLRNVTYNFDASELYPAPKPVLYQRDAFGLRGYYKDVGALDVLTIGGSTTDQRYLSEGQTWQDVIRREGLRHGQDPIIVNAGVDGQSTAGHLLDFTQWFPLVPKLRARYVLAYVGINDFFAKPRSDKDDLLGGLTVKGKIKAKSVFYKIYQLVQGNYLAYFKYPLSHRPVNFKNVMWVQAGVQASPQESMQAFIVAYKQRLQLLRDAIVQFGAVPIFVTQEARMYRRESEPVTGVAERINWNGHWINGVDFYFMFSMLNAATMEQCREMRGICIDLAQDLSLQDDAYYDYFHNTPAGAEKIGRFLYERLHKLF